MKIGEKIYYDDSNDRIVVESTYENQPYLDRAALIREKNSGIMGESRLVGTIPMHLIKEWCKEAGVKWSDTEAQKEIVKKKILSGDFDKLRVWKGTY